ncbi:quercetin 2,3-dioxygenase [Amycolatopsis sp. NPDC004169]|uniref:quercetin 2,3-dioxygenase n=1 Tax=Amycolatopsis sp. NPDC004169 TaxID=3154453 RepID=UPI0033A80AC4
MTEKTSTAPFHLPKDGGQALWHLGALVTYKATSADTGEQFWLQEAYGARGYASPFHRHSLEDEGFYVLDGSVSIYVGDDVTLATPGSFLWAPRDIVHAFCVESETAKFLAFSTGGKFDQFFFDTGEPAASLTIPPPPEGEPDVPRLAAAMAEYGVEMVGPPPAPRT